MKIEFEFKFKVGDLVEEIENPGKSVEILDAAYRIDSDQSGIWYTIEESPFGCQKSVLESQIILWEGPREEPALKQEFKKGDWVTFLDEKKVRQVAKISKVPPLELKYQFCNFENYDKVIFMDELEHINLIPSLSRK